jgi:cytochrome c-type biogenesis protein CcmH
MSRYLWLLIAWLLLAPVAPAGQAALPAAADPQLEARLNVLAADLRCVVCQNESLAESRAALALDLRAEIREMMYAGMADDQVLESLVARYGDFILYRPPVKPLTYALWGGPFVFLLLGAGIALASLRRRQALAAEADVDPEALRQAALLLRADASTDAGSPSAPVTGSPSQEER